MLWRFIAHDYMSAEKMNNYPKVTIVTVTYNLIKANRKSVFEQCVESVHNQTYKNIEHIVIDGASSDGTLELLKAYSDKGYFKYYSEPDNGIYEAMNKGLKKATGEYIAFLNSDDFYHNEHGVEEVVKALLSSKADFCYGQCRYLFENGELCGHLVNVIGAWYARMPFSHQSLFVKTSLMRALGGFDETFKSSGDYDFIIRMIMSGAKECETPCEFVSFRLGGFSCTDSESSIKEGLRSFRKNYGLENIKDCEKLYFYLKVPKHLFHKLKDMVSESIRDKMQQVYTKSLFGKGEIAKYPYVDGTIRLKHFCYNIKFFNFISILNANLNSDGNIKNINEKIRTFDLYLLKKIPLFSYKEKVDEMIIKILSIPVLRKWVVIKTSSICMRYYVFGIPVMKVIRKKLSI